MATNDFLPFGGAAGANVMTQANYAALAARTAGFSAGTANSAQLNKVWRQSSLIAAVVGQVISDWSGGDAVDDGTIANLVIGIQKAVRALKNIARFTASGSFTVPVGVTQLWVSGCAGGGGGAGTASTSTQINAGGGGGGAGQSAIRTPFTVTPGQVITITIGAAGAAGAFGGAGGAGGNTVVGSLVTLVAGGGGGPSSGPTTGTSGGGAAGNGFPAGSTGNDQIGAGAGGSGGAGASGPFGGGGGSPKAVGGGTAIAGPAAVGFGGGGAGAGGVNATSFAGAALGGAGAPGLVILEW
jgi:hypothetical protein